VVGLRCLGLVGDLSLNGGLLESHLALASTKGRNALSSPSLSLDDWRTIRPGPDSKTYDLVDCRGGT